MLLNLRLADVRSAIFYAGFEEARTHVAPN